MILAKYTQVKGIEGVFPVIVGPERAAQMTSNMEGWSQPYTLSSFCPRKAPGESYYVKPITSCPVLRHTVAMLARTKANR